MADFDCAEKEGKWYAVDQQGSIRDIYDCGGTGTIQIGTASEDTDFIIMDNVFVSSYSGPSLTDVDCGASNCDDVACDNDSGYVIDYPSSDIDHSSLSSTLEISKIVLPDDTEWKGKPLEDHIPKVFMRFDELGCLVIEGDHVTVQDSFIKGKVSLNGDHTTIQRCIMIQDCIYESPIPTFKVCEEGGNMKVTGLDLGIWVTIFIVAVIAAKLSPSINWRVLLWPVKKLFGFGKKEAKEAKEAWDSIEEE